MSCIDPNAPMLPPGPFALLVTARPVQHQGAGHVYIVDASGRKIASVWGTPDEKMALADMIITAREKNK